MSRFQVHRDLALLVIVVVGCAIPFLTQPFHMDDNFYMDMARNVRAQPFHPYNKPYDIGGFHAPEMAFASHPPLQAYVLAAVQRFAGEEDGNEWVYHMVALVFPILAVVSLYFISARLVERPMWPSMVLAVCPLVLVMEHTLMPDVPALAFWLAAVACFLWATELNRKSLYVASSLCQFAAMFSSYQAVLLVLLLGFYQIRKRGRTSGWIALLLPLVAIGAWLSLISIRSGHFVLADAVGSVRPGSVGALSALGTKMLALMEYQGWLVVFPFFLLYVFARGLRHRLLVLSFLASVCLAQAVVPAYRLLDKTIFVFGLTTGIFISVHMAVLLRDAFRKGGAQTLGFGPVEAQFIVLWYFGVAAYCLFFVTEGSARHVLPLVPPFLIIYYRRLEIAEVLEYRLESRPLLNCAMVASGSLVLSLAWGMLLAQADFELARIYPRAAAAFSRLSSGLDAYITGEWGFRYYFGRIGAKPLPADESSVRGGGLVVKPKLAMPYGVPADLNSITIPFAGLSFNLRTPFRTVDWHSPAGFYSSRRGLIPFSLSRESQEIVEIRQVSFMVEQLPEARVESASGVMPWPGFLSIRDRTLAILAKPGTRIVYPWTMRSPMNLVLRIGVLCDAACTDDTGFVFAVQYRDAQGKISSQFAKTLHPGTRKEDRDLQPVRLVLPASVTGAEALEFRYLTAAKSNVTGAFVEALLMPM
jgi:hypothetical protein